MNSLKECIILAGGKGTRLASRLNGLPKPLVHIVDTPLLQRQILHCKKFGIESILLLVNHRASDIAEFCNQNNNFDIHIRLVDDGEPRGTGGAALAALPNIASNSQDVLIMYGDTLLNVDLRRFYAAHVAKGADVSLFLHPNTHPQDSDLVELDCFGYLTQLHSYPHPEGSEYPNLVNAALYIVKKSILEDFSYLVEHTLKTIDFAKDVFPLMLKRGVKLYGYISPEYIKDIGTPERLDCAEADILSGRFAKGILSLPQKAVFLDRDGVLNEEVGYITKPAQLKLHLGSAQAVRRLNKAGILAVVITNQPVLARGECSEAELKAVHTRLEHLLGLEGAYIDKLYYCPHHPDKGFEGERAELKVVCSCRKPAIGMLLKAKDDLHIDVQASWFIGDRKSDIQCAKNAGCHSILTSQNLSEDKNLIFRDSDDVQPDFLVKDLAAAVDLILHQQETTR